MFPDIWFTFIIKKMEYIFKNLNKENIIKNKDYEMFVLDILHIILNKILN